MRASALATAIAVMLGMLRGGETQEAEFSFDNGWTGWKTGDQIGSSGTADCDAGCGQWTRDMIDASYNTGPNNDHTQPVDGDGYFLYINSGDYDDGSSSTDWVDSTNSYLESPGFSASGNGDIMIQFYYFMYCYWEDVYPTYGWNYVGRLELEVFDSGAWTQQWNMTGNQGASWIAARVTVPATASRMRFVGVTKNNDYSDLAIDDVSIFVAPTGTPTLPPTPAPSLIPSAAPSQLPSSSPSQLPSSAPTETPSTQPTPAPSQIPTANPSQLPTLLPTPTPSFPPTTAAPTPYPALTIVPPQVYLTAEKPNTAQASLCVNTPRQHEPPAVHPAQPHTRDCACSVPRRLASWLTLACPLVCCCSGTW